MFNLNQGLWYYIVNVANDGLSAGKYFLLTLGFALISVISGYLLGSINSAILVSKLKYGEDIRKFGSGNAGMTNMLRTYGKGAAALTAVGDIMKTVLAICIGGILGGFCYMGGISVGGLYCELPLAYIAGFFAIVGHILPIFYGFKGGKGVLCTAAMALVLTPAEFAFLFLVFVLVVYLSKYISLGSVSVAFLYPIAVSFHIRLAFSGANVQNGIMALITIIIAIIVIYCHRGNLKRISEGTERKLSVGSRKSDSTKNDQTK